MPLIISLIRASFFIDNINAANVGKAADVLQLFLNKSAVIWVRLNAGSQVS